MTALVENPTGDLGDVALGKVALFLDFDGVLVDLAAGPDEIEVPPSLPDLLSNLFEATSGAMAIVTGREARDLRKHLPGVQCNVIGSHGAEFRLVGERADNHPIIGSDTVVQVQARAEALRKLSPGIHIEMKPTGAVAHFRKAPEMEGAVRAACNGIVEDFEGFECHDAKCAVELRPEDVGKWKAVKRAMQHKVFASRVPVYFGDDTTDEPAMAWVKMNAGLAIKVGEGDSVATVRLDHPRDVRAVLSDWLDAAGGRA